MQFGRIWVLRGPNIWAMHPVIEAEIDLASRDDRLANDLLTLIRRLQSAIGEPTTIGLVHPTRRTGYFRVVFSYGEEALARRLLSEADRLVEATHLNETIDESAVIATLRTLALEVRLGPSTRSLVVAAEQRGIPARRLNDGSLVQLGWGVRQRRIWTAESDQTPAIAETIAQDKELTRRLLAGIGCPVPYGRPVTSADDAWVASLEIGLPVVVKPRYGNQGRGVATDLQTREQVLAAYAAASEESPFVMVEKFFPGADYRLLVIGGRLVAAALREPAHVIGDGKTAITELIALVNRDPRRSDGHSTALSFLKLDPIAMGVLEEQRLTPESIPEAGRKVWIRRNANLSTGGTAHDVTEQVHPDVAGCAIDAALAIGLDIAGVDIVATSISQPLDAQNGGIVEVNAGPGLRMHLEPSGGQAQPVGSSIVNSLFPVGDNGRIPIIAITGTNGKTTTTRLMAHLCRSAGRFTAMTCTDGIYLDGRRTETRDCSGPQSARAVLLNPRVEVAILETARGGILREGLAFDTCDVGIVTNIGKGDHLGLRDIETIQELAHVKEVVIRAVSPTGFGVLNAADPLVSAMAVHCPGQVVFFAREPGFVHLAQQHRGGRAVFVRDHAIILADGEHEERLIDLHEVSFTREGHVAFQVENALAATAAAWCLKLPIETIRHGLRTFNGDAEEVPGRFNVLNAGEATVIVDYAHNPSAVEALVAGLDAFSHTRRTLVFSGCNRRDSDLLEMGEELGHAFDRVVLYADRGNNGRDDGELNAVLRRGLERGRRVREVIEVATESAAVEQTLRELHGDELLVIGVEAIEQSLAFVRQQLG